MILGLLAAGTMLVADIVATIMVQAEAANRGWLAGLLDAVGWLVSITTTAISVNVLTGHYSTSDKAWVIGLVTAANVLGTKIGAMIGARLLATKNEQLIAAAARSGR